VSYKAKILAGIEAGAPVTGPTSVHIDVTNSCNAACVTCWDHSPLLTRPRPQSWKRRRLELTDFARLVDSLAAMGSLRAVILSGMGEPLIHPDIYAMIGMVKARGWELTVLSNLVAADIDKLAGSGVDRVLAGVHGVTPKSYAAFHPGFGDRHFSTLCRHLRRLHAAAIACRHVQVINRDTAPELVAMVRFGKSFRADRVNFKLASLRGGTEARAITPEQRDWLREEGITQARELAAELGVATNLDCFATQVEAALGGVEVTAPIADIGCYMGYVYTRITVDREVLFCCNDEISVGSMASAQSDFADLWYGATWQAVRDRLRSGSYFSGCDRCGKLEQNLVWQRRCRERAALTG
jgi:MoaA/NifB/PqqE/SkfB family radical SAM enzyme